jgi:shikimate dehydrogenase
MKYGLIAERVGHSYSKVIHTMLADYDYELVAIAPDELDSFMTAREFSAINVTMPYKQAVIPYLDFISDQAKEIGAVNTIVNKNGKLYGYNTDFFGLCSLIKKVGIDLRGKKVLVLGTGGTSRTACAVAGSLGASEIIRVGRNADNGAISYAEAYETHADTDVIINTTPVGMFPNIEGSAVDISRFSHLSGVIDAVYNPMRTELILDARAREIAAEGGLYMLVAQAVAACEIFLDRKLPEGEIDRVFSKLSADKESVVLIGMPASGKSTIGRLIAEKTGREFFDLDDEIVKSVGKSIPEIFAEGGEEAFRNIESRVLADRLAFIGGAVIATGGGAILREENVRKLKQNGRLYFLNRPLCQLLPTADRPTASTKEAIEKRYGERLPIYKRVADVELLTDGVAEHTAERIIALHYNEV